MPNKSQVSSKAFKFQDPFEIVKDFRTVQLKKRRKILRAFSKEKKIREMRGFVFNAKVQI